MHMKAVYLLAAITISITSHSAHASELKRLDYEGFTVWVDCDKRGAVKFQYNAQHDTGSYKRLKSFHIDPNVPSSCQQLSAKTYKQKGQRYDRGHLVPANHLDYSKVAIRQSNFMTNILPQAANMNRGAWLLTEEITECYRDIDELLVIGGVLWGDNLNDDFFTESHGVKTPDASWKVIIRNDRAIAWIIPNIADAKRNRLDEYIVTIQELELVTGESIPVDEYLKHEKPEYSWVIPRGCNKG
ncbi:MAG TPA: DNA/RNA non-specific endonuclease [Methylococcaceae bacterium]|nr:DNA/RNA non-specific endonuclease [Methylococcaceae bacterium]HIB62147.1 DNA/RNA non-specific endonuclease [Methylococcaceae bacterium]HIN69377.1 DNA/RNA non-specific endonuclease [Methylococcales bacterium]